ncbi:hypothetical protein ACHAWF_018770 [Thalassiosira exigua]
MESLPTDLLALSLSYLDYRHAVRMALVSRRFRASIIPDGDWVNAAYGATATVATTTADSDAISSSDQTVQDFWRSLCKSTFHMDDERFLE